jgi:hypothetical protein
VSESATPSINPGRRRFLRQSFAFSALASLGSLPASARGLFPNAMASAKTAGVKSADLLMVGDWGSENVSAQAAVASAMRSYAQGNAVQPQALLMLGDNWYGALPGGANSPRWDRQFEAMYPADVFPGPAYALLGNHDYQNYPESKVSAELDYARSDRSGGKTTRFFLPSRWYRFEFPTVNPLITVIALDSNMPFPDGTTVKGRDFTLSHEMQAEQLTWLEAQLKQPRTTPFLVVMGHHPVYSNGTHGDHPVLVRDWDPLLRKYNVHCYFAGHDHDLQHLEFDGHPTSFFLSGGGGADLYTLKVQPSVRGPYAQKVYGFSHLSRHAARDRSAPSRYQRPHSARLCQECARQSPSHGLSAVSLPTPAPPAPRAASLQPSRQHPEQGSSRGDIPQGRVKVPMASPHLPSPGSRSFVPKLALILLFCSIPARGQANRGELDLRITDPKGAPVKAPVRIVSEANQYDVTLSSSANGRLEASHLPFGLYRLEIHQPGFASVSQPIRIASSIPVHQAVRLALATVRQSVTVDAADTLLQTDQAGAVNQIGAREIENRLGSIPGRDIQDLVNSQPGWLYEGNAVLHPRGSEYQTQFVIDGIPLTDDRSPSFGPEIEADDVQALTIYTAGIPAEYGRKMGGVVEMTTQQNSNPGFHGQASLYDGSFASAGLAAKGQYTWGRDTLGLSGDGSRTDHYLNPVVPQNYSNTGTLGDFSADFRRDLTAADRLTLSLRHELARYDSPNELVQQAAGQRQNADNFETMGIASYQHTFSPDTIGEAHGMVRDNSNDFYSNPASIPVYVNQHNSFREGYFRGSVTWSHGRQEWKAGVESDNTFLHENTCYTTTQDEADNAHPARAATPGPSAGSLFGTSCAAVNAPGNPPFVFQAARPDLEQAVYVEDLIRLNHWTISAGLRWDHYQLVINDQGVQPRLSISRYLSSANTVLHFSYDRIFQTPSFENLLLSSSTQVESIDPTDFLRLPVKPSKGDYYEGGLSTVLRRHLKLDANYFRRFVNNYADDDQIDNTSISFPISFRKSIIYGAEGKLQVPDWHRFSGFLSYSYEVGNVWNPVTGGLFLGDDADAAASALTGHFPDSQDQRNTVRGRVRYQATPRLWLATGIQYDTGLPFEFDGDRSQALAQYGQQIIDRINFNRGRILPSFQVNASAGVDFLNSDRVKMHLQADGQNLNNVLDVIDFGGLFSGNAIGPSRSFSLRLTASF